MNSLIDEIRSCTICAGFLPNPPRPIVQASPKSRILIIGQAPGQKVQNTGIPWNDPSGDELRRWLGVDRDTFYNADIFALMPMGFCYTGKGKSGDLPPRPECPPAWHRKLLAFMPNVGLTLLIGQYAQHYYLGDKFRENITDNVKHYGEFLPAFFPLVHPSPRNRIWQKRNPWFVEEVVSELARHVAGNLL